MDVPRGGRLYWGEQQPDRRGGGFCNPAATIPRQKFDRVHYDQWSSTECVPCARIQNATFRRFSGVVNRLSTAVGA